MTLLRLDNLIGIFALLLSLTMYHGMMFFSMLDNTAFCSMDMPGVQSTDALATWWEKLSEKQKKEFIAQKELHTDWR